MNATINQFGPQGSSQARVPACISSLDLAAGDCAHPPPLFPGGST